MSEQSFREGYRTGFDDQIEGGIPLEDLSWEHSDEKARNEANLVALSGIQPGDRVSIEEGYVLCIDEGLTQPVARIEKPRTNASLASVSFLMPMLKAAAHSPDFKVVKAERAAADDKGGEV